MRTILAGQSYCRYILIVLACLVGTAHLAGCPKRQDGLVFDDTSSETKKDKKRSKSSKGGDMMYGRVVDRNDQPMKRVTILVSPGNGELISNKWGEYEIDGLHSDDGTRIPLTRGQDYTINAWKPGYHETTQIFRFEGDAQEVPTITLIEDTIKLEDVEQVPLIPSDDDTAGQDGVGKSVENE